MTNHDRSHELSREAQLNDAAAGKFLHSMEEVPESIELNSDEVHNIQSALDEMWASYNHDDMQDAQREPEEIFPNTAAESSHKFTSAEEMRTYYERIKLGAKAYKAAQNPDGRTPDLNLAEAPAHPHPEPQPIANFIREDGESPSESDEEVVTQIQSLFELLSTRQWEKLSQMTHTMIDSLVIHLYNREGIDDVPKRALAARIMMDDIGEIGRIYHEWLLEMIAKKVHAKFGDEADPSKIQETCRVLLLQEIKSDLLA